MPADTGLYQLLYQTKLGLHWPSQYCKAFVWVQVQSKFPTLTTLPSKGYQHTQFQWISAWAHKRKKKNLINKQINVKHAWKHLRGNSSLHVALQSKLTASFNNDPPLSLHRGVKRVKAHRVGSPYRPHTLPLYVPLLLWQMDVFFYSSRSISFVTKWKMCIFFHSSFRSHPNSSPLSNRAFDQGQTGASYLFCSPVEPGRLRGPAAVLFVTKSLRGMEVKGASQSYSHWMLQHHALFIKMHIK